MADWPRVVLDTSILIPFYNKGLHAEALLRLTQVSILFFHATTINEFLRGAHDATSQDIVQDLLEIAGENILVPSKEHWIECGRISEKILKKKKRNKEGVLLLQNDILIALGTRDIKACLMTADRKDFRLISDFIHTMIEY